MPRSRGKRIRISPTPGATQRDRPPPPSERRGTAGPHPCGVCRKPRGLRLAAHLAAASSPRHSCGQAACATADAAARHSRPRQVERLQGQRFETIRQAKDETIAWLLWYNQTRLHSTLGYASPIERSGESCRLSAVTIAMKRTVSPSTKKLRSLPSQRKSRRVPSTSHSTALKTKV
jgi:hypothetical protein